ncbi:hypothetical protein DY000_02021027 [Brassica cretica]|uniref:USP domain-containing protein n=1 Tax=Brassica cretica TaxID=69181 RepID=A0ABQ7EJE1_BRACR|nr:hypothetical protein DY000_02021027 [Brassica cretica]
MDGDLTIIRLSTSFDTRYSFELAFQCLQFEVNQHHVDEVIPVLLKSGQSASQEEDVEEINDCRSIIQHWCRSTVMPERGSSILQGRLKPRSHTKSLKEISSELTIRGRYEEEAIVRCTSSTVDRYIIEASTIEDYDRSMYILYHRSMSKRKMRDLVPADFKPKASPNYKITPNEFLT